MSRSACASSRGTSPARTTRRSSRWRSPCFYVVDARRSDAFGLQKLAASQPIARVVDGEDAHRDPIFPVGTALIRIWSELDGEPPVCVELGLRG